MGKISKQNAHNQISKLLLEADKLKTIPVLNGSIIYNSEFNKWYKLAESRINRIFGAENHYLKDFNDINYSPPIMLGKVMGSFKNSATQGLEEAKAHLLAMLDDIDNWADDVEHSDEAKKMDITLNSNKIFVVYGHDSVSLSQAENMIYKIGLSPITLPERESKGNTIIEKFERLSQECCFALILCTPDDEGKEKSDKVLNNRARQNVILELGYFYGLFGRARVFVARKENVELPSDMHGIIHAEYINDVCEIKEKLIRELDSCEIKHK